MTGESVQVEAPAVVETSDVETQAKKMGWIPQDQFRGNQEEFIPAEEYLRRGNEMLPILRANNRRMETELEKLRRELTETRQANKTTESTIESLKEFQASIAIERAKTKRSELLAAIKTANEDGNDDAVDELRDELEAVKSVIKEGTTTSVKAAPKVEVPAEPEVSPEMRAWTKSNEWFGVDKRRTAMAVQIGQEIREEGSNLQGADFLAEVELRVSEFFGDVRKVSKVEASRQSSGAGSSPVRQKGYSQLPAEAKAACDRLQARFIGTGPGKFKDAAAWQAQYAKTFFDQE